MSTLVAILEFVVIFGPIVLGAAVGMNGGGTGAAIITIFGGWGVAIGLCLAIVKICNRGLDRQAAEARDLNNQIRESVLEEVERTSNLEANWAENGYYFMGDRFFGIEHFAKKLDSVVKPQELFGLVHHDTFDEAFLLRWLGEVELYIMMHNETGRHAFPIPKDLSKDGKKHTVEFDLEKPSQVSYKITFKEVA